MRKAWINRWCLSVMVLAGTSSAFSQQAGNRPYEYFIRFEHLSVNDGLSQSTGRDILQDNKGFIWIATQDGLNKYDGQHLTVYKHHSDDTNTVADNFILCLYEDHRGHLWIGTNGAGISCFDPEKNHFRHFRHDPSNPHTLSNNLVHDIFEDRSGVVWAATEDGLNRFDAQAESFQRMPLNGISWAPAYISCIYEDSKARFWLGTAGAGLLEYDREKATVVRQFIHQSGKNSIGGDYLEAILEDHRGDLWIAGPGCPLTRWDETTGSFTVFSHQPSDPGSISDNVIYSLYETDVGQPVLWIGTQRNGLERFVWETESFIHYRNDPDDPFSLANNIIFSMHASDDGTMWLGTGGGGVSKFSLRGSMFHTFRNPRGQPANFVWSLLARDSTQVIIGTQNSGIYIFDRQSQVFTPYPFDRDQPEASCSYDIYALHRHSDGALWIGTSNHGLYRIDKARGQYDHFMHNPENDHTLAHNWVRCIYEAPDQTLWIGTANGLSHFNPLNRRFKSYRPRPGDSTSLSYSTIQGLIQDHQGSLWVGTYGGGLNRLDIQKGTFKQYHHQLNDPHSLSNDRIRTLYEDTTGRLWIGTDLGLNAYQRDQDHFTVLTMENGLPNNVIYAVLPDKRGNLWLSTNRGLSVFNPEEQTFTNYDARHGIQSNEFNTGAYYLGQNGEMFFGGIDGFNIFHPDRIQANPFIPPVMITGVSLFNQPLTPGQKEDMTKSIIATDKIRLRYNQNFLSFQFAAFNFINSTNNQFRYRMEGLDPDWIDAGNRGFASYPDLKPGHYTFHVIGANNDGLWNETGDRLQISIIPPWWFSSLAWIIYAILTILGLYTYITWRTHRLAKEKNLLEQQIQIRTEEIAHQKKEIETQRDSLEELNAAKDKLFTIIGHDLKNPLTSLLSVSHSLRENLEHLTRNEVKQAIASLDHSAHHLFRLLENLLEWTRTQTGHLPIHRCPFYLNDLIHQNLIELSSMALKKDITLEKQLSASNPVYADKNMISTVVRNLLNNAIKFTPRGGRICICSFQDNTRMRVEVTDTGRGITEKQMDRLFRIESTLSTRGTENEKGTGLGLLLCKDLVEKNGGHLRVVSSPGKGSTFIFTIPSSRENT